LLVDSVENMMMHGLANPKFGKILLRREGHRWQYGACALHTG